MTIRNLTRKTMIADAVTCADTPFKRMAGLLGRKAFNAGEALVITPCQSVHMFFMKFSMDVIFVDRRGVVAGLCPCIQPFCLSPFFLKARSAIEVPAGTIGSSQTQIGDTIQIN